MSRIQSPILSIEDNSNYWFVVQWIGRRFDEEERDRNKTVISESVVRAIDHGSSDLDLTHTRTRESWRELQRQWIDGWDKQETNSLRDPKAYFDDLVTRTNAWIDRNFPSGKSDMGLERRRLLGAVRQQRLKESRKSKTLHGAIQVTISGNLYQKLYRCWKIPESKRHDVVRAALEIILEEPDLLNRAKIVAGITVQNEK